MKAFLFLRARWPVVLLGLLTSCAFPGTETVPRRVAFDDSAFAGYGKAGSGTVSGKLVVTSGDGVVHAGSANQNMMGDTAVTLLPVTAYTREMVEREIGNGDRLPSSDPRFQKYVRLAKTDANGNFAFHQVPAGDYFVSGMGEWLEMGEFKYQWACERVKVGSGQSVNIKLTHNLNHPASPLLVLSALE